MGNGRGEGDVRSRTLKVVEPWIYLQGTDPFLKDYRYKLYISLPPAWCPSVSCWMTGSGLEISIVGLTRTVSSRYPVRLVSFTVSRWRKGIRDSIFSVLHPFFTGLLYFPLISRGHSKENRAISVWNTIFWTALGICFLVFSILDLRTIFRNVWACSN